MFALEPSSCLLIPKSPSLTTPSLVRNMLAVFRSLYVRTKSTEPSDDETILAGTLLTCLLFNYKSGLGKTNSGIIQIQERPKLVSVNNFFFHLKHNSANLPTISGLQQASKRMTLLNKKLLLIQEC